MREIKFRAWNGESMNFGGFSIHAGGNIQGSMFINPEILEVMQFTGLQDKDGVDIYEGDVVNSDCYSGGAWFGRNQPRTKYVIKYNNDTGRFCFKQTDRMGDDNSMEVIGNIHENPELLESVK
jgi:uncharacterized phage protein (TIGR01671 family)